MRKMYLFLSLALLFCSVNVTWGRIQKKDPQQTTLGIQAPADGMMLAFNRIAYNASGTESNLWLCASSDEVPKLTTVSVGEPQSNNTAWILEASDVVIEEGVQSFYLKNLETDSYLYFVGGSEDPENDDAFLALGDKGLAKSFIIVPTKQGAPLMGSEKTDFEGKGGVLKDGDWMILSKVNDEYRNINTYAGAGSQGFMGIYADYASWYTAYEVEAFESTIAELQDALAEMPELNVKGGTAPGCYPAALVEEYTEARAAVYDLTQLIEDPSVEVAQAAIARLRAADAAIKAASRVPVTTGFYRIVSAFPAFEQQQGIRYAMGTSGTAPNWSAYNTELDAQVWSITSKGDDSFTIQNIGNLLFIAAPAAIGASQPVNLMTAEPTEDIITITFFDNASSARIKINGSPDLHANGHGGGAGKGSNIVFWNGESSNASAWFIEPVTTEEEAKFTAIMEQNRITNEFNKVLAEAQAKYDIAAVYKKAADAKGLITEVEQLSSNADNNAFVDAGAYLDGQGLAGLIDDDVHTFFHSLWAAVKGAPAAYHNLTVDLKQPLDKFAFSMTPRKYTPKDGYDPSDPNTYGLQNKLNNRPTEIVLYGAVAGADIDDPASWEKLRTITGLPSSDVRPADDAELPFTSPGYSLLGEYQYLRFEVTKTNNGQTINVGGKAYPFFTMAEFQIFNAELDETSQMAGLGEVGTAFEEALKQALKVEIPTQADIDALRAALQAFIEGGLADPTELGALLSEAEAFVAGIIEVEDEEDKQPGKYPMDTQATLEGAIEVAQAYYDETIGQTAQGLKDMVTMLRDALNTAKSSIFGFDLNTWYRIRHCQTFYEVNGVPELQPEARTGEVYTVNGVDEGVEGGSIRYGIQDGQEDSQFLWRLVPVEGKEGVYALQNKATNMFIGGFGTRNYAITTLNPVFFTIESVGYAAYAATGTELDGTAVYSQNASFTGCNVLHAQTDGKVLVYWTSKGIPVLNADKTGLADNSGASWEFIPEEEFYDDDEQPYNISVAKGQLQTACYPFSTTLNGEGLVAYSISAISEDGSSLFLTEEGQEEVDLEAGKPIIYMAGDITDPNDYVQPATATSKDSTYVTILVNSDFITAPLTENGLIGRFWNNKGTVDAGYGVFKVVEGENAVAPLAEETNIGANKAYINKSLISGTASDDDIEVKITGDLVDAIQNAIVDRLNSTVDVYTIDGIRVRQAVKYGKATEGLQKGLYIINKKVVAID